MRRIQVQARARRRELDLELSTNLDLRDPDILRAKHIARSLRLQETVPSTLDRKEV
jgi:hypothetical protein